MTSKSTLGKRSRAAGKRFESKVRKDLEDNGWQVCKWTNNVDFEADKIVPAKSKYNPFLKRVISEGSGFPDYIAFKLNPHLIIGVESKKAKYLDQNEKRMVEWLKKKKVFMHFFVAYPKQEKGKRNIEVGYYIP